MNVRCSFDPEVQRKGVGACTGIDLVMRILLQTGEQFKIFIDRRNDQS